jgi:hypothetical protein
MKHLTAFTAAPSAIIAQLNPTGRAVMTRSMELIRKIILEIQQRKTLVPDAIEIPDVDPAIVARHVELMLHAGLIEGVVTAAYNAPYPTIHVKDLTWAGHDFADTVGNDRVWTKMKQKFSPGELVSMPLDIIKQVGVGLLTEMAKSQAGLS